jgi:hypothetical protein
MWSDGYKNAWGCRCCSSGGEDDGVANNLNWDVYEVGCGCRDSAGTAKDEYGDGCEWYDKYGGGFWCGKYDDVDFKAKEMCCACRQSGGGSSGGSGSNTGSVVIIVPVVCGVVLIAALVYAIARKRKTAKTQHRESSMPSVPLETSTTD